MAYEDVAPEQTGQPGDTQAQPAAVPTPAGQDGVPLSDSQALNQGDTGQPAPGQDQGIMIPKERLDEISAENQELRQQLQQIQYMQAMNMQQQHANQPQNGSPYDDLDDDDYVSVAKAKKDRESLLQAVSQTATVTARVAVFHATHNDTSEVVGTKDPYTGQWNVSPYLLEALNRNPAERMYLQTLDEASQLERAYHLASEVKKSKLPPKQNVNTPDLTRQYNMNTANANLSPLPASSAGGAGAVASRLHESHEFGALQMDAYGFG